MPTNYMPAKNVAKLVRAELKAAYPGTKFSVRTRNSLTLEIEWTDGPATVVIKAMTDKYAGQGFDPMQDMRTDRKAGTEIDGIRYEFLTDFVFVTRHISPEVEAEIKQELAEAISRDTGEPVDLILWDHTRVWDAPALYSREIEFGPWTAGIYLFTQKLAEARASL